MKACKCLLCLFYNDFTTTITTSLFHWRSHPLYRFSMAGKYSWYQQSSRHFKALKGEPCPAHSRHLPHRSPGLLNSHLFVSIQQAALSTLSAYRWRMAQQKLRRTWTKSWSASLCQTTPISAQQVQCTHSPPPLLFAYPPHLRPGHQPSHFLIPSIHQSRHPHHLQSLSITLPTPAASSHCDFLLQNSTRTLPHFSSMLHLLAKELSSSSHHLRLTAHR